MEKVFSRWPSHTQLSARTNDEGPKPGYPEWMRTPLKTDWLRRTITLGAAAVAVILPVTVAFAGGITEGAIGSVPISLTLALVVSLAASLTFVLRLSATRHHYKRRYEAVFEHASVSNWLEDWSAVGTRIANSTGWC